MKIRFTVCEGKYQFSSIRAPSLYVVSWIVWGVCGWFDRKLNLSGETPCLLRSRRSSSFTRRTAKSANDKLMIILMKKLPHHRFILLLYTVIISAALVPHSFALQTRAHKDVIIFYYSLRVMVMNGWTWMKTIIGAQYCYFGECLLLFFWGWWRWWGGSDVFWAVQKMKRKCALSSFPVKFINLFSPFGRENWFMIDFGMYSTLLITLLLVYRSIVSNLIQFFYSVVCLD